MSEGISDQAVRDAAQSVIDAAHDKWHDFYYYSFMSNGITHNGMDEERKKEIKEITSDIMERFEQNLTHVPSDFDELIYWIGNVGAAFSQSATKFGDPRLESIDTAKNRLVEWDGAMKNGHQKRSFIEQARRAWMIGAAGVGRWSRGPAGPWDTTSPPNPDTPIGCPDRRPSSASPWC